MSVNRKLVDWLDRNGASIPMIEKIAALNPSSAEDWDVAINPAVVTEQKLYDAFLTIATAKINGDHRIDYKAGCYFELMDYIGLLLAEDKFGWR